MILTKRLLIFAYLKISLPSLEIRKICGALQTLDRQRFQNTSPFPPIFMPAIEY